MEIETWLEKFKHHWKNHDINGVISLFSKKLTYFETPFLKINNLKDLSKEWQVIKDQDNIKLDY